MERRNSERYKNSSSEEKRRFLVPANNHLQNWNFAGNESKKFVQFNLPQERKIERIRSYTTSAFDINDFSPSQNKNNSRSSSISSTISSGAFFFLNFISKLFFSSKQQYSTKIKSETYLKIRISLFFFLNFIFLAFEQENVPSNTPNLFSSSLEDSQSKSSDEITDFPDSSSTSKFLSSQRNMKISKTTKNDINEEQPTVRYRTRTIENSNELFGLTVLQNQRSHFNLLQINPKLSESIQKKIHEIRNQLPEEFDQLLPTLLELGIILWPKRWFDRQEELTSKDLRQRQRFVSILEKHHQETQYLNNIRRLYGKNVVQVNDKKKIFLLRENLSHDGQLCLLSAYREEIEKELTKKVRLWKSFSMKSFLSSLSGESHLTNQSTYTNTIDPFRPILMAPRINSSLKTKQYTNIYLLIRNKNFMAQFPEDVDEDWQRKLIGKIIEQGMKILDSARNLSFTQITSYENDESREYQIVRAFKRWIFLWFNFFLDETTESLLPI